MYSNNFCKIYNEFGWNYFPEAFGEQLLLWLSQNQVPVKTSLDLACGTGILCEILYGHGIDASGMDFSDGMIRIARESNPNIHYEVADMIRYRPEKRFDLVTCTGDALNHILSLADVEQIFRNVYSYLSAGGYFIFDLLNEKEAAPGEPFELDYSETVKARLQITRDQKGIIHLKTSVFENGSLQFEEDITEILHDPDTICELLRKTGFQVLKCADQLLEDSDIHGTTWFIIARKQESL